MTICGTFFLPWYAHQISGEKMTFHRRLFPFAVSSLRSVSMSVFTYLLFCCCFFFLLYFVFMAFKFESQHVSNKRQRINIFLNDLNGAHTHTHAVIVFHIWNMHIYMINDTLKTKEPENESTIWIKSQGFVIISSKSQKKREKKKMWKKPLVAVMKLMLLLLLLLLFVILLMSH